MLRGNGWSIAFRSECGHAFGCPRSAREPTCESPLPVADLGHGGCALRIQCLVPGLLALTLCGCAIDPYVWGSKVATVGDWKVERQEDRVTGRPVSSAYVLTRWGSNTRAVVPQVVSLQLMCFIDKPVVRFTFQAKVGTNLNSFLGYRFDDKPGHEIGARFVQGSSVVVIEDQAEVAQFVNELATSKSLYVRLRSLAADRNSAEFNVEGAPAAIESALSGCPVVSPGQTPREAAPLPRRRSA
jgi:hypothetical protein